VLARPLRLPSDQHRGEAGDLPVRRQRSRSIRAWISKKSSPRGPTAATSAIVVLDNGSVTDVAIRPATADEVEGLPAMQVAAGALFPELGMHLVSDGPAHSVDGFRQARAHGDLLVAADGGKIVGFVRTKVLDGSLHVEQVTVAPGWQGRGIGRALMLAVEQAAAGRGFTRMTLTTFRDVPFNDPFYERLGWTRLDADSLTPGLAAERDEEMRAGLDLWPRTAMGKSLR
jgi:GNAT superfamily N-acetyltransferase